MGAELEFFNYGWLVERLMAKKMLKPPTGDKADFEPVLGALCIHTDGQLYIGNGTGWNLAAGAGGGDGEPLISGSTVDTFWNGLKAFVQINTDQLTEGTKKFFTAALARAAITATSPLHFNATTGVLTLDPASALILHGTSPINYDAGTGTFSLDLATLDARYGASVSALDFSSGLLKAGSTVIALTENALWNANKLQGYPVTSEEPANEMILVFNGTTSTWELATRITSEGGAAAVLTVNSIAPDVAGNVNTVEVIASVFGRTGIITAQANDYTFAQLASKPTTLSGYGITDAFTQAMADLLYAVIGHVHSFASLTSTPTTLSGYGITDGQFGVSDVTFTGDRTVDFADSNLIFNNVNYLSVDNSDGYTSTISPLVFTTYIMKLRTVDGSHFVSLSPNFLSANRTINFPDKNGTLAISATTLAGYGITDAYPLAGNPSGFLTSIAAQSFASLTGKPTTIAGYGITDLNTLGDARWALLVHTHTFASLTSIPTTIAGYGITDFNSLGDARWSLLAHTHTFASLTSKPTTLSGYGITDGLTNVLTSAMVFIGNGSNIATGVAVSGDITITNAGVVAIGALKVTNAMLAGSIAMSKLTGVLPIANGGTNFSSYAIGDILYASSAGALAKRVIGSTGMVLTVASGVPTWATPPVANGTTSGYLSSTDWINFNNKVYSISFNDGNSIYIPTSFTIDAFGSATATLVLGTKTANTFFAGGVAGGAAQPSFRAIVSADLPAATTSAKGAVSVGNGLAITSGVLRASRAIATQVADYDIVSGDGTIICDNTEAVMITLPTTDITGAYYTIKKVSVASLDVTVRAGAFIDGVYTLVLTDQYQFITVQFDGTTWWTI